MPDNGKAERSTRFVSLGKKSVGTEGGGKAAAITGTLIETAKLNTVDPQAWLNGVLERISDQKIAQFEKFMLWIWSSESNEKWQRNKSHDNSR